VHVDQENRVEPSRSVGRISDVYVEHSLHCRDVEAIGQDGSIHSAVSENFLDFADIYNNDPIYGEETSALHLDEALVQAAKSSIATQSSSSSALLPKQLSCAYRVTEEKSVELSSGMSGESDFDVERGVHETVCKCATQENKDCTTDSSSVDVHQRSLKSSVSLRNSIVKAVTNLGTTETCFVSTHMNEKVFTGTNLHLESETSCKLRAAWHACILEPSDTFETASPANAFELVLSATNFVVAEGYRPNDLQVHNEASRVALASVTALASFCACRTTSGQMEYRNVGIKIRCYLFVYRWMHLMIAWLNFRKFVPESLFHSKD